ncbi:hypothetical protein LOD99_5140 [Oopsacas minuta]|uniref:Multidrug and toxin extrusion protein n=1 Tax=Oopsacas minuta TaxID=111878 RepID=A0AAV7JRX7_9METZ|nr:hypothetical protein LOD99_5140 [Oopsacas minuta]
MHESEKYQNLPSTKWYRKLLSFWIIHECIIINKLAWPSVLSSFSTTMLSVICLIFTGHIGRGVYLDGTALALSFANVTGTSIVVGLSSGMDTLCSQAYGGKNYRIVGVYFQRASILCLLVCFPIWAMWLNTESLLILLHQDVEVAAIAGKYLRILCVAKPAVIIYILSTKFLQTQNVVNPTIFLTAIGNVVNIGCHYLFVVHLGLGVEGSAMALSLSYWSLAILYLLYIRFSSLYHTSWPGWSCDALKGWLHYCKYGVPGLIMICFEWWAFEIGYLVVGATSAYPKVEIGIYSIMFKISDQLYSIPIGYTVAATVRVGNLLGANNPKLARRVAYLCLSIIFVIGLHFSAGVLLLRYHLPHLFTKDACIIAGASQTLVVIGIFENADGFQLMASGILKGCGRQGIASITNLLIYQFFATPLAICLSVGLKMATKGYFIGMGSAVFLQAILYNILLVCTNWRRVADIAQDNVGFSQLNNDSSSSTNDLARSNNELNPFLTHNISKTSRSCMIGYQDIVKIVIIVVLIASFVVGLGFSFYRPPSSNVFITAPFNTSSSLNNTQITCPY